MKPGPLAREELTQHFREIFRQGTEDPPWPRMAICGLATGIPLLIGYLFGDLSFAIYGSLIGYFIGLNDHLGVGWHRALVATLGFLFFSLGLVVGVSLHGHGDLYVVVITGTVYWLGLMGASGAEVERILLFSIIEILVGNYATRIDLTMAPKILIYAAIAWIVNLIGVALTVWLKHGRHMEFARLRPALKQSLSRQLMRHLYAFSFALMVFAAMVVIRVFEFPRGYWVIVTMVLVMRPDRKEAIYRGVQRLTGTFCGIWIGASLVHWIASVEILILLTTLAAFLIPYEMKRNYALVSFLVTLVVLFLLTLPTVGHLDPALPGQRLRATMLGCAMCLFGILFYKFSGDWVRRRLAQKAAPL